MFSKEKEASHTFLIYCCLMNHHRLSDIQQHTLTISYSVLLRHPGTAQLGSLLWVSSGCRQALGRDRVSAEARVGKHQLPSCFGGLAGLAGPKSPSCGWLSLGEHSQLLEDSVTWPPHRCPHKMTAHFLKGSKGGSLFLKALCDCRSSRPYPIIQSNSQTPLIFKGWGLYKTSVSLGRSPHAISTTSLKSLLNNYVNLSIS